MTPAERTDDADDLSWLAFCYAAGELDADAEAAFERRLDADPAACEALAEAVRLGEAVARAAAPAPVFRLNVPLRRVAAVAAAACLVLAVGARRFVVDRGNAPADEPGAGAVARVALTWSDLRQGAGDDLVNGPDDESDDLAAAPEPVEAADAFPGWLIEAAALRDAPAPEGRGS